MTPFEEYLSIVLYWQNNPPPENVPCHNHHIWPLSCGGPNRKWNKVKLPIKEHYKCHKLLPLIYTGENQLKMARAWHRMHFSDDGVEITAEEYERLMTLHNEAQRKKMIGKRPLCGFKKGNVPWNKGNKTGPQSDVHRKAIGDGNRGKPKCPEMGKHLSEAITGHKGYFTGKTHTEETKKKISEKAIARGPRGAAAGGIPWTEERRRKVKETWARKKQAN